MELGVEIAAVENSCQRGAISNKTKAFAWKELPSMFYASREQSCSHISWALSLDLPLKDGDLEGRIIPCSCSL